MIDSHAHLDLIERPATEVVADAEAAGVRRILSVGIDSSSCRLALQLAEDFPQIKAAIGRHPNGATGFDDADAAELAALAAHLRAFRRTTGLTPHGYVTARRMERALRLLQSTDWPIPEIAARLSYANPAHFRRAFRKAFGVAPGEIARRS